MLAKKKKLTKKEIKEDKLVTSYFRVQQFYSEYQSKILSVVAAVAVVVVIYVFYTNNMAKNNLAATTELSRIMEIYNSGSYQEAIDGHPGTNLVGLKAIVDEYGSTEQGENAKIFLANSHYYLGDFDVARKFYSSYSGDNSLFKATALAGIAACDEAQGEYSDAADNYYDAAKLSDENPSNGEYLLLAGINYKKVGDSDAAKKIFESIVKDYAGSPSAIEANKQLATVSE